MNKIDIIEHIARSADISKAAAGRALEATIAIRMTDWPSVPAPSSPRKTACVPR